MPDGKPAGVRCVQLLHDNRCRIFGLPERPRCCSGLQPSPEMCGSSRTDALQWLARLEVATQPAVSEAHRVDDPPQAGSRVRSRP
jgi:hypothetical protein